MINSPGTFSNDLLGFFVPTWTVWLGGQAFAGFTSRFCGNPAEQNGYLGLPLIALAMVACRGMRGAAWVTALAAVTVLSAVFSMGPVLRLAGLDPDFAAVSSRT